MIVYDIDGFLSKSAPLESLYTDINTGELYVKLADINQGCVRWLTKPEAEDQYDCKYVEHLFNSERFSYLFN